MCFWCFWGLVPLAVALIVALGSSCGWGSCSKPIPLLVATPLRFQVSHGHIMVRTLRCFFGLRRTGRPHPAGGYWPLGGFLLVPCLLLVELGFVDYFGYFRLATLVNFRLATLVNFRLATLELFSCYITLSYMNGPDERSLRQE